MFNNIATSKKSAGIHAHRRLLRIALNVRGYFPAIALLNFLYAGVVISQMFLLSSVIHDVFILSSPPGRLSIYLLVMSIVSRAMLIWYRERFAQKQAVCFKRQIRLDLVNNLMKLGPTYVNASKPGELVAIAVDGVEKLDDYFTRYIPSLIQLLILPTTIIAFSMAFDLLSGLIMLVTAPLILFFMWLIGTYAKKITTEQWRGLSLMSSHFLDALQGLKTLKVFGANQREAVAVEETSNNFRIITMKVLTVAFVSGFVLELAASISIALVAVQVGIRLIEGMIGYQAGLFILLLAPELYLPFRALGQHHHAGMEGAAAAETIFEINDNSTRATPQTESTVFPGKKPQRTDALLIECEAITFSYPESVRPAANNISCQFHPGTLTAIVGKTGAGKTTLAYMLMGYLNPSSGRIVVNGEPLGSHGKNDWLEQIAYVGQHAYFFNSTVLENLLMAKPGASLEQVSEAAKMAYAHDFIEKLPDGYHTFISENASKLSGGEKQRLAIARAYLKDAPLLIFDEPTSNLDPESEAMIAEAMTKLVKGRTAIVIAHRLRTVVRADNIIVLDQGKLVESGNHNSLMLQNGYYARFLNIAGFKQATQT